MFIGYAQGYLGIFDIQQHQTVKNTQILSSNIHSMAFTRDNISAYVSDWSGNIKMIEWTESGDSTPTFDLTQEFTQVGNKWTYIICLTENERILLVGSKE